MMKIEIEFEEVERLKNEIIDLKHQNESLRSEVAALSPSGTKAQAQKIADEYLAVFFESIGVEYDEHATSFWKNPPGKDWSGSCHLGLSIGRHSDGERAYSAQVKFIE